MVKFDENQTHGFGGEDFSRNFYVVLYKNLGVVPGVTTCELDQGHKLESDVEAL